MSKTILITGANGRVGSALVKYIDSIGKPYTLRLADLEITEARGIKVDVSDFASCKAACESVDTVIHLAGVASPDSSFEQVLPANIVGTYNIFQAASECDVKRVIYASSAQAIEGYPLDIQIKSDMPVRPKNLYGVSKAFGEAVGMGYRHLETDLRLTGDGVLVCFHDATVDRTTNGTGPVVSYDYEELLALEMDEHLHRRQGERTRGVHHRSSRAVPAAAELLRPFAVEGRPGALRGDDSPRFRSRRRHRGAILRRTRRVLDGR